MVVLYSVQKNEIYSMHFKLIILFLMLNKKYISHLKNLTGGVLIFQTMNHKSNLKHEFQESHTGRLPSHSKNDC